MVQARTEDEHRDDHGNAERGADERGAHRDRLPGGAAVECEADTDPDGRRCADVDCRPLHRAQPDGAPRAAIGPGGAQPGEQRDHRDRTHDHRDAAEDDERVEPQPRSGLRLGRHADRETIRQEVCTDGGQRRTDKRGGEPDGSRRQDPVPWPHAQRAQRGLIDVDDGHLPRQCHRDADERGDRGDDRRDDQRDGGHIDGVLRALTLDAEPLHLELARLAEEVTRGIGHLRDIDRAPIGAHPQDLSGEGPDLVPVARQECRCRDDHASCGAATTEIQRTAHDPDDAERDLRAPRLGELVVVAEECLLDLLHGVGAELDPVAHAQVKLVGKGFSDRDLVHLRRIGRAALDDEWTVDGAAEVPVDLRRRRQKGLRRLRDQRQLIEPGEVAHAGTASELREAGRARGTHSDLDVGRMAVRLEPIERRRRAARAAGESKHYRAGEGDQQRQDDDTAPSTTQFGSREQPDRRHVAPSPLLPA